MYGCKEITTCHFDAILTASVVAGLSCSVVSGLLNWIANSLFEKEWNFNILIFAFNGEYMDLLTASIIGRIPVTILDRVVTTFLGFGISKLYSRIIYRGEVKIGGSMLTLIRYGKYEKNPFAVFSYHASSFMQAKSSG